MKRFIAVLTAAAMLFSAAACGSNDSTEQTTTIDTLPPTSADEPPVTTTAAAETADHTEESKSIIEQAAEKLVKIPTEFASEEDKAAFDLLGDYYTSDAWVDDTYGETIRSMFHVSGEDWEQSQDYELFREYFFGTWEADNRNPPLVIDDSESAWLAEHCMAFFFMDFYKVGEDALVFEIGSAAGASLYWLDKNEPDTLYAADGAPGGFPNGISLREDGSPGVWTLHKSDAAPNEPENGYLSVYRLREMAQKHGIDYEMLVKFELADVMWSGHDGRYYFYPMYLVSEADDRIEIKTQAGDVYSYTVDIGLLLEKVDGEWVRTVETSEEFFLVTAYLLIEARWNDNRGICVDLSSMPVCEDYDLFRQYFFGTWDSRDTRLPWSITLDDSENINFAGLGHFGEFYQPSDHVIMFTLLNNALCRLFWLDMDHPNVLYAAPCIMSDKTAILTIQEMTTGGDPLIKSAAAPSEPSDGFLSIFKLHEMARDYGIDFDLLTNVDCGMIDGKYYLHSAAYDFYPMYLVSEADDKIVIRTTVGNVAETDLKPIEVICTFEKKGGEWVRTVEFDGEVRLKEN